MRLLLLLVIVGKISQVVSDSLVEFETPTGCHGNVRYDFVNPTIVRTTTALGCGRKCGKISSCLAFNSRKDGASTICELGNQATAVGNCSKLQFSDGSIYMEKITPCENGGYWDEEAGACLDCADGYTGTHCERLFRGCKEAATTNGVQTIQTLSTNEPITVLCNKAQTIIERRGFSGPIVDFNRTWDEYKHGFGGMHLINGNFFLGLERIHEITSTSDCHFVINAFSTSDRAKYHSWVIASEDESYAMDYNDYVSASPLDDGLVDLKTAKFSTHDRGNASICAAETGSGWWFNTDCSGVNMHKQKIGGSVVLQWPVNGIQTTFTKFWVYLLC